MGAAFSFAWRFVKQQLIDRPLQALRQSMAILPYSYALMLNIFTSLDRIQAF